MMPGSRILAAWPKARRHSFGADWQAGLSQEDMAEKYRLRGNPWWAVGRIVKCLGLAPRKPAVRKKVAKIFKVRRNCLMHGGSFMSTGPGNRICGTCKGKAVYRTGEDMTIGGVNAKGGLAHVDH